MTPFIAQIDPPAAAPLIVFEDLLEKTGLPEGWIPVSSSLLLALTLILAAIVGNLLTKSLILRLVKKGVRRSRNTWDDKLMERSVFTRLSHLVPGLILYYGVLLFPSDALGHWLQRLALVYMYLALAFSIHALLNAVDDIYRSFSFASSRPIKGYIQTIQLLLWISAGIFALAGLLNRSPAGFLTGLGALSAVLMLVFRDSILGLVAGIQITFNNMVRLGDWIEMPKYGADGDVIDITLHTVKVQNWDKTITTIPTAKLIQDSFKNWRGMQESGGRRIKRSIFIDIQSVQFLDDSLKQRLLEIDWLKEYLEERGSEIDQWNAEQQLGGDCPLNGRRLTNLGCFRHYIEAYLHHHPKIHQSGMTFLVRQLAPGDKGIALELYVFTNDTRWVFYEGIQADIFDHLLAAIRWFELRAYQAPSGSDVERALSGQG